MKRIMLSVMLLAFAVAVQAGDAKTSQDKDAPACCASKMKTSNEAKGTCPFAKAACCKQKQVKQTVLLSPKAIDTAR
jgi:hypothetical protein